MEPLFEIGPTYDPHIKSIIKSMLSRLRNNHPKTEDKVWVRNANWIKELYDGTYLTHRFNLERNDDPKFCFEKVRECKGSWNNTRSLINSVMDNIDLAKNKDYMPFNKKFVESISFATFFEHRDMTSKSSEKCSNFLNFIITPKRSYEHISDLTIEKLKRQCSNTILETGTKLCKRYMSEKSHELSFWYSMTDWTRWLKKFKETFPNEYGEFLMNCENGNPLLDFRCYLMVVLKYRQGENIIVGPECFKLSRLGSNSLEGYFKNWLRNGIEKNKFEILKHLPKSIEKYYTDESFEKTKVNLEKKVEKKKEVFDADDLPIF